MRVLLIFLLLSGAVAAKDWKSHLSPRLKAKFASMLREDWDPKKEVELTPQERADWRREAERIRKEAEEKRQKPPAKETPAKK